jgi:hypothetical protein
VIEMLPQFYKNLFSGRSSISEDFWISREKEEEMFNTALRRNLTLYHGGIMVIGERNSGKTAFCRNMSERHFKKDKAHHIFPPAKGSCLVTDFEAEIRKVTKTQGTLEEIFELLPKGSMLCIHDMELWWERSAGGWDVINLLIRLINEYSHKFLFVVNTNPYAFSLMNKIVNFQDIFVSVIPLRPFGSMDLHEMIIRRHRSSGLKFVLHKTEEDDLSEIRLASLFNKYFDYSEGNPGTALKSWLSNIIKISDQKVYIKPPAIPDTRILTEMDDDWKILLIQLFLHKRMTYARINRMFFQDDVRTRGIIGSMSRAGIIEEKIEDLYVVNNYIEPHLIRALKREGLL